MNCPVCKYPNPQGATHCGMCYEVFNRSAAQAYLQAVRRERQQTDDPPPEKPPKKSSPPGEGKLQKLVTLLNKVDWNKLADTALEKAKRHQKVIWGLGAVLLLWILAGFLLDPALWYHLFGKKLTYSVPSRESQQYLMGLSQNIKIWSERQGRLDTPLEQFSAEEIGNVLETGEKPSSKSTRTARMHVREWIQILHDAHGATSHAIPPKHPSLAEARVLFDKKGSLLERRYTLTSRLGKGLPFLTPRFPKNSLRRGESWTESVEWIDYYNDWKIYWGGSLQWTAGDLEPCGKDTCLHMTYQTVLHPQLKAWPSWAANAVKSIKGQAVAEGSALFDPGHKRLVSNTFSYDGILYIPLKDLGRIPWNLRIGKRVRGVVGEIALRFENKIDVRKN